MLRLVGITHFRRRKLWQRAVLALTLGGVVGAPGCALLPGGGAHPEPPPSPTVSVTPPNPEDATLPLLVPLTPAPGAAAPSVQRPPAPSLAALKQALEQARRQQRIGLFREAGGAFADIVRQAPGSPE
ncbi:MAG: hypothetical protein NTZ05_21450, partial [Chloroflexi bacterium]|nr:hypothetical protein [Chloroflexota bacterium]